MAYDASNEVQTEILTLDKDTSGNKIRVSKIEKKGTDKVLVDIRNYFTDKDGNVKPTSRGIRISSEISGEIIVAMIKALGKDVEQDILSELTEQ